MHALKLFRALALLCLSHCIFCQTGDVCSDPLLIALNDPANIPCTYEQISSLDFNNFNSHAGVPNPGCSYGATNHDLWIKTTIPANSDGLKITLDSTVTTDNDYRNFVAAVYTGPDCSSLTYRTCKTTSRSSVYNNFFDGFTPGETVYIRVYRKNSTSGTWDRPFFLRLTAINTLTSEDACAYAKPLLMGTYCNYTSTDKGESDDNAPDKLTGTDNVCQPGSLPFGSFDNNQWYYFEVFPATLQPVQIDINNVGCSAGDQILQVSIWKTTSFNCSNWTDGHDLNDASNADDGDLVACAVGSGNVSISKNLPPGKYWYTVDGSAGAFCQYSLVTSTDPPLPVLFADIRIQDEKLSWHCLDDADILYYCVEASADGEHFSCVDTFASKRAHFLSSYSTFLSADFYYYRIAAVSLGGRVQYSPVVTSEASLRVSVTYLEEGIRISSGLPANEAMKVQLFNTTGQVIYSSTETRSEIFIALPALPPILFLKIEGRDFFWAKKMVR